MELHEAAQLAKEAHAGQFDKIGVPYIEHVRAVSAGLASFGTDLQMAGLLHDVVEDTDWTLQQLREAGVPAGVVHTVGLVTRHPLDSYDATIRMITSSRDATLVKISDNAHNSHPDRAAKLPPEKFQKFADRYAQARTKLWPHVSPDDVYAIVSVVNPALLLQLEKETFLRWI